MEQKKIAHLIQVPFTGLGLYNGFRGNRWLRNRIQIFKQFVIPSLKTQTDQDFILWIAWRREERFNKQVQEFKKYLENKFQKVVFTFSGCPIYDDKYSDLQAYKRLVEALHGSMGELINIMGEADIVLLTLQPSDDLYSKDVFKGIKAIFKETDYEAFGFEKGYIMNYKTLEVSDYNPTTNPPFYTIKFDKKIFIEPLKHIQYISLKKDIGKYKAGTPIPSHEYVKDCLKYGTIRDRSFIVGCHGENISTFYDHPFKGEQHLGTREILNNFGLENAEALKLKFSLRKWILRKLPHKARRKLRYWWGEKIYNFLRA